MYQMDGQLVKDPTLWGKILYGAYPKDVDIALQGRYNTDLILKDRDQVWVRVGQT